MTTKRAHSKPLVIVESPAKARTITKYLGPDFTVAASVGHVRDLPANASEVPAALKKEKWSRLGIDIDNDFAPLYVVPKDKREHIRKLKQLVKDADILYLATDEDREGESISWHLLQELKPKADVKRLVFHEITESAIQHALEHPRDIDQDLVEAQETRRLVDRLYGYSVSPLLWRKIRPKLSAGRVQSVAVRLVVEREHERLRFVATEYWGIKGVFEAAGQAPFEANLTSVAGRRIALGKDFEPDTGQLKQSGSPPLHLTESGARALAGRLGGKDARVKSLEQKPYTERPSPPFTTSTLQQEAGRKLGFTAKRTMRGAQRLYENGYVTYMRTDSTTLSSEAISAARKLIAAAYGVENLPDTPRIYKTKVKNAQEAHEAIRPAGSRFVDPKSLGADMGADERRLYDLIWKRTVACQMKDAKGKRTTLALEIDDARFQTSGRTIEFPGFRLAYVEHGEGNGSGNNGEGRSDGSGNNGEGRSDGSGGNGEGRSDADRLLPRVVEGDRVETRELAPEGHSTKPAARLTEASLIKELEARGIGRPSTYASIIDTILTREYCFKKGNALVPTFTAFAVVNLLDTHLHHLVDYAFTARMEDDLDEISNGRKQRLDYLKGFFLGNGEPGLKGTLEQADKKIDPRVVCTVSIYDLGTYGQNEAPIEVRVGRFGPFLSCNRVSASLSSELAPDELTRELACELLAKASQGPKSLGADPETGLQVYVKSGRFGPYFQLGDAESLGDAKPKMASLLPGMEEETVTLAQALQVLALPRKLGKVKTPDTDDEPGKEHEVEAHNGRFGPYLKWGKETRSIPAGDGLLTIDLKRALELFAQPKARGRGRAASTAKVLKELGEHPATKAALRVLDGRYGPYVTDGNVNATIPKGESVDELGLARAVELIDAKAARGPATRRKTRSSGKSTKKKSAKKTAKKTTERTRKKAKA